MNNQSENTIGNSERWKKHRRTIPYGAFVASAAYRAGWDRIWGDDQAEDGSNSESQDKVAVSGEGRCYCS